jgi:uncharacterized membrane protein YgdD (TMEM256/DUF423 family)
MKSGSAFEVPSDLEFRFSAFFRISDFGFRCASAHHRPISVSAPLATRIAAALGLLAVVLGAFGAHGLKEILARNGTAIIWERAVFYHALHAVMLFLLASRAPLQAGPWFSFLGGILIFSGSLYLLAVTNLRWLGAITPIGGVSFLVGWLWLVIRPKDET